MRTAVLASSVVLDEQGHRRRVGPADEERGDSGSPAQRHAEAATSREPGDQGGQDRPPAWPGPA
eukprot:8456391-Pyramimonas_sp.AAC.1